ncbi:MAG: OmpA family protein [Saprospiraceae bacterium]|nr:OmpA family protein [Lewinella sp.]
MRFFYPLFLFFPFALSAQSTFDSLTLVASKVVYFDFGKHELRPDADSTLREVQTIFERSAPLKIHITAHTDAIGNDQNNQALSDRRAESVRTALAGLGIPDSVLVIETFGEHHPVASNADDTGRQLNRRVTIDLYEPKHMRFLTGQIRDEESGEGIYADIILRGKQFRDSLSTDSSGHFRHAVPDQEVIGLDVYAKDHFFQSKLFKATDGVVLDLNLPPARKGESADIENLYFKGDQAVLLPRSEPELPKVLRFMQVNPQLKIEIAGHINYPNSPPVEQDSWYWQLSVARAKLVYDYLLKNNIDPSRIKYAGYGNTQMRYPKATSEQEQALNRRVEIRVLEN